MKSLTVCTVFLSVRCDKIFAIYPQKNQKKSTLIDNITKSVCTVKHRCTNTLQMMRFVIESWQHRHNYISIRRGNNYKKSHYFKS